jgi:hypothetical protein
VKFDRYDIQARLLPAVLCSMPVLLFQYYYLNKHLADFSEAILKVRFIGPITLPIALIYLFMQVNRFIAKEIFEKRYFKSELHMPTTNFLLHGDSQYTPDYKKDIYARIRQDFGIRLATPRQEQEDEASARKKIAEAVSLIRTKTRGRDLLLRHNIEYGFARNLIGGSLLAVLLCLFDAAFFKYVAHNDSAVPVSLALAAIYLIPVLLAKPIIERYGKLYAKLLIQEFMYSATTANE